jgi:Icc-related predicted phosphoesterase
MEYGMKLLALSDQVVDLVYGPRLRMNFKDIDLIVGCGDLPEYYLEFVVSMCNVPMIYVPGNHDNDDLKVPGGISVDGEICQVGGIWVAGLGGSRRYKPQGKHQYTESQMRFRVSKIIWRAFWKCRLFKNGIDLMVTHSPPRWIHDREDLAHKGFEVFHLALKVLKPKMLLHGHSHVIRNLETTETRYRETEIINVFPYRVIDFMEGRRA